MPTEKQLAFLEELCAELRISVQTVTQQTFGKPRNLEALSVSEASELIEELLHLKERER